MANTLMGVFMYAVHFFAKTMPQAEYGVFTTMLQVVNLIGVPAIGIQSVFAHQAAMVTSESERLQLQATARTVLAWTFGLWAILAVGVLLFHSPLVTLLQMSSATALWVTLIIGLAALWFPVWQGLLQGQQDFLWLGWASIANGLVRFIAVAILVAWLGGHAGSALGGALAGYAVALCVTFWRGRAWIAKPASNFDARAWLRRVVPLTLGIGTGMFVLSADMIVVQAIFDRERTGFYAAAGMIGRALVFFTIPVTAVMFPKVVRSTATASKSSVLALTLALTAGLGASAAIVCTIVPWLPIQIVQGTKYLAAAPLVPWFAWCMLPLTLANVLINNLMAQSRFDAVPWLVIVAAGYAAALMTFSTTFEATIRTLGVFGLLLLATAAWFTWVKRPALTAPACS